MRKLWDKFWAWYERHHALNTIVAAVLFLLQLVHLYWLTAHVAALRLVGESYFELTGIWEFIIIFVDYLEIPTLIGVSLIYINELRKGFRWKPLWMLLFLNSQWIHILWITDEFVVERLLGSGLVTLPVWLAWVAIAIDYLELPVIYDTIKRSLHLLSGKKKAT